MTRVLPPCSSNQSPHVFAFLQLTQLASQQNLIRGVVWRVDVGCVVLVLCREERMVEEGLIRWQA